jgi:DNA repair protein RadA/Sms
VLAAVLQKHCRIPLGTADIFLNVAGGFTVSEPAVDLGLAMAMVSSYKNMALPEKTLFIGEVGLLGEIRNVNYLDRRIKEAKRLGFTHVISRQTHSSVSAVLKEVLHI